MEWVLVGMMIVIGGDTFNVPYGEGFTPAMAPVGVEYKCFAKFRSKVPKMPTKSGFVYGPDTYEYKKIEVECR